MSQNTSITDQRHNDYVGSDANVGRIPGAGNATTGHHYVEVFPKGARPQEHLPPSTGRDLPPKGVTPSQEYALARKIAPSEKKATTTNRDNTFTERQTTNQVRPLDPAPDSNTVIDNDPYATPTTAGDTLTGATSKDVHAGIGKPASGMTSAEMHHDGHQHRKRNLQGTAQYGNADELYKGFEDRENPRRR
ncbi:hypothetical protein K474DRAFT_1649276 [Panus rudis PR-1116 ss-1]|nr:hypothetical protein K474DRAFT_1649276 [Panus rudis PR-1116 ss-1]